MWIIDFLKANCKNCYACVRACPVHAIKVQSEQAKIMKERCIGCGKCLKVCPKNAKHVQSERYKVKTYLEAGEKVVVSLAPSFAAVFKEKSNKAAALLKQLGFYAVEETVVGAGLITKVYEQYAYKEEPQCYITSCCPTINVMIQKHYPEVIPYLIPVDSPVSCHSKLLKRKYGESAKVVFIGPCLSKKIEGIEEETLDAVLTFEELLEWQQACQIDLDSLEAVPFEATMISERQYPLVGGVTENIKKEGLKREIIHVDGIEECMAIMPEIIKGKFNHTLLEMHGCRHGCIAGAGMPQDGLNFYEREKAVRLYAKSEPFVKEEAPVTADIDVYRAFTNLHQSLKIPSEVEINDILNRIGKETPLDELNCGSCGYETCRDKAIAVYNGLAEPNMCLPFMRQKAEKLTNVIFEATPNLIIMVNEALEIIEMNPVAKRFFKLEEREEGMPISALLDETLFKQVCLTKQKVLNQKGIIKTTGEVIIQSVIWSDYHHIMLWIASDITFEEQKAKRMQQMKINAIDMAQAVINKQMTVAQEIASLLGETTAETKVTLTKLKQLIEEEEANK